MGSPRIFVPQRRPLCHTPSGRLRNRQGGHSKLLWLLRSHGGSSESLALLACKLLVCESSSRRVAAGPSDLPSTGTLPILPGTVLAPQKSRGDPSGIEFIKGAPDEDARCVLWHSFWSDSAANFRAIPVSLIKAWARKTNPLSRLCA